VAGVLLLALVLLGIGGRIMTWLPLPIVMGMFAGSILEYIVRMVKATVEDVAVAGTAFSVLGITSAFWAILAGVAASACAERRQLIEFWSGK